MFPHCDMDRRRLNNGNCPRGGQPPPTDHGATPVLSHPRALPLLVAGAFFMEYLDGTVIATALPQMALSFGLRPVDVSLGMSAYLLTLAVFLPASGYMAERFGARRVFTSAVVVFTVASIACGVSIGLKTFVAARILQGVGGAMMVPVGRLVVLRTTAKKDLMSAVATLTWPALMAPILAPPLGGFLTAYASWRWIFFINVPLGLFGIWLALRLVPTERGGHSQRFDILGFVLTAFAVLALMGVTEIVGRDVIDWRLIGILLPASAFLGYLAVRHMRRSAAPILDLATLKVPSFAVSVVGGSLFRMAVSAIPFLLPLLFQVGFGLDAFHSGLLVLALFVGNVGIKPVTTPILRRFGFRATIVGNGLLTAGGILLCATLRPSTSVWLVVAILGFGGATRSMGLTAISTIAFADVEERRMNGANTLFNMLQQMSLGLGVALGSLCLRIAQLWRPPGAAHATPAEFSIAFGLVSLIALVAIADAIALPADAGAQVARG
ncbi:MAG TPA: MFS transporter [Lichenihabitans sp.]|nr:MFS transporter [Lichenihabitans sp.]